MRPAQFVFGYGSLLCHDAQQARLNGFRRTWNVAMDNMVDLAGYKSYRDSNDARPPVYVTFVNLTPSVGDAVNGIVFAVSAQDLHELDLRERNYERVDVTGQIGDAPSGTVWAYLGAAAARQRYERGLAEGRAVVSREYYESVRDGFASLGAVALADYEASTDAPVCPIRDLTRIELA